MEQDGDDPVDMEDVNVTPSKLKRTTYEREPARLQLELVKVQHWVKHAGLRSGRGYALAARSLSERCIGVASRIVV